VTTKKANKVPAVTIPSDDCIVHVGMVVEDGKIVEEGESYAVHQGETVTLIPNPNVREYLALQRLSAALANGVPDGDAGREAERALDDLCDLLARRIVSWTWTDEYGDPWPQPKRNPAVLKELDSEELFYLVSAAKGEAPGQRKNGSRPSAGTS